MFIYSFKFKKRGKEMISDIFSAKNKTKSKENYQINKKTKILINIKKYWPLYIMVIPGVAFLIAFRYIPLAGSIIAFQDYSIHKGLFNSEWVGLKHFKALINYPYFRRVFKNTIILGFSRTMLTFPIPVILSLMLNEIRKKRMKKLIQTSLYIPHFLSWVIVAGLTFDILGIGGIFNNIRHALGYEPILIMQKEAYFRGIYILTGIWKDAGWGMVIYLAALSSIDPTLYESAMIDGAVRLKQILYITLPLILPTIITVFLLNIGSFLELGFDHVFNLLTPMTYNVGDIIDTYIYRAGIQQAQYSFTTAVGLFQSVIGFSLVFSFNRIANKFSEGGLW